MKGRVLVVQVVASWALFLKQLRLLDIELLYFLETAKSLLIVNLLRATKIWQGMFMNF